MQANIRATHYTTMRYFAPRKRGMSRFPCKHLLRKHILALLLFLPQVSLHPSDWAFVVNGPHPPLLYYEAVAGVAFDGSNSAFFAGAFKSTVSIGHTNLTAKGEFDCFAAKFDLNGDLAWVQQFGGNGADVKCTAISADTQGNAYLSGHFIGTVSIGASNLTSLGSYNVFIAKFSPTGDLHFLKAYGSPGRILSSAISVSSTDQIFITGLFENTATFGTNIFETTSKFDLFVLKTDPIGTVTWAQRSYLDGTNAYAMGTSVAACPDGGVYVCGTFKQPPFDGTNFGTNTFISAGREDAFIAKYSASGHLDWIKQGAGPDVDVAQTVSIQPTNGCYVTGRFVGSANLFGSNVVSHGYTDVFTAAFQSEGTLAWLRQVPAAEACSHSADHDGSVYVLLRFLYGVGFDNLQGGGALLKYRHDGRQMWLRPLGVTGSNGNDLIGTAAITNDSLLISANHRANLGFTNVSEGAIFARVSAPLPNLRISQQGEDVVVAWPGWADNFSLELNLLSPTSNLWVPSSAPFAHSEIQYSIRTNAHTAGAVFRLRR